MKRTGFKKPTLAEVRAKQAAKSPKLPQVKSKPKKRTKLPTTKSMRNKCDKLLTPIIQKMYPYCLLTGAPTEVAHHHVKKSESSALRYYLPNLIPLTHKAHQALHAHETIYSSKIVAIKGIDWWNDLEREKKREMKCDVHYYIAEYARLKELHDSL